MKPWLRLLGLGVAALGAGCSSEVITLAELDTGEAGVPGGNGGAGAGVGGAAGQAGAAYGGAAYGGAGAAGAAGIAGWGGLYAGVGASAGAAGEFCTPSSGCGGATYCEPDGCGLLTGTCQPVPDTCDGLQEPSCGCDGLTYWNGCVRAWAGVGELHPGECAPGFAKECSEGQPCAEPYATCFSSEPSCQAAACWVLPCPGLPPEVLVTRCDSSATCVDACAGMTTSPVHVDGSCN